MSSSDGVAPAAAASRKHLQFEPNPRLSSQSPPLLARISSLSTFSFSRRQSQTSSTASTTTVNLPPQPYRIWFHPYLSWMDVFLSILLSWIFDFRKLNKTHPTSVEAQTHVNKFRQSMNQNDKYMIRNEIQQWNTACGDENYDPIVECRIENIPFQTDILSKWNILPTDDDNDDDTTTKEQTKKLWNTHVDVATSRNQDLRQQRREYVQQVIVRFPLSLLSKDEKHQMGIDDAIDQDSSKTSKNKKKKYTTTESGCIHLKTDQVVDFNLREFIRRHQQQSQNTNANKDAANRSDVPVLVQFHGGGLIISEANQSQLVGEAVQLIKSQHRRLSQKEQKQQQQQQQSTEKKSFSSSSSSSSTAIITISVEYGMAPDQPWPVGIIDSLSVVDYLLNDDDDDDTVPASHTESNHSSATRLHWSGVSAGGHFALIVGLEASRRYPGRIQSVQCQAPMLNPAGDTMSYWMNGTIFPTKDWLRWCWRSYLRMDDVVGPPDNYAFPLLLTTRKNLTETEDPQDIIDDTLRQGSNYTSWKEWKELNGPILSRLVFPIDDIPPMRNNTMTTKTVLDRSSLSSSSSSYTAPTVATSVSSSSSSPSSSSPSPSSDPIPSPVFLISTNKGDPLLDDGRQIINPLKEAGATVLHFDLDGLHCSVGDPTSSSLPVKNRFDVWSDILFTT